MLSTSRLKHIYAQEQKNRKYVCVMNDVVKTRQEILEGHINREKVESVQRNQKSIVYTRRNIARQRVLQQCMSSRREEVERTDTSGMYGRYYGVPVEQIAAGIDTYLEQNHPRIRRRKKINDQLEEGYAKGTILDNATVISKVNAYFDRPLVNVHRIDSDLRNSEKRAGHAAAIAAGFYTGNLRKPTEKVAERPHRSRKELSKINEEDDEGGKLFIQRKVTKFLQEDVPDNVSIHSARQEAHLLTNKSTNDVRPVTLPPMKLGSDKATEKRPDTIAELVAKVREHKLLLDRKRQIRAARERPRDIDAPTAQLRKSDAYPNSIYTNMSNRKEMSTGAAQTTPKPKQKHVEKEGIDTHDKLMYPSPRHADKNARVLPPLNIKHSFATVTR